jgi:t-SNARE complex subunit (syntaxin)
MNVQLHKQTKINKLQNDISDIHSMCKDLNDVIKLQSETIENISISTEKTNDNLENTVKELKQAKIYSKKALTRNIIIGTVVGACIGGPLGSVIGGLKTTAVCTFSGFIAPIVV